MNIELLKRIKNKEVELTNELRDDLITAINEKTLKVEDLDLIFGYDLAYFDNICGECFGLVKSNLSGLSVCYACRNIEGKQLEFNEFPLLGICYDVRSELAMIIPENFANEDSDI